ncbi:MAG: hypothetical protein AVDCRST_MAG60-1001, partial [uncultured Nocardioides sp.]
VIAARRRVLRRDRPGQAARPRQVAPRHLHRVPTPGPGGCLRSRHGGSSAADARRRGCPGGHRRPPVRSGAEPRRRRGHPRRDERGPQRHPATSRCRVRTPMAGHTSRRPVRRPAVPADRRPRGGAVHDRGCVLRARRGRYRHDDVLRTARGVRAVLRRELRRRAPSARSRGDRLGGSESEARRRRPLRPRPSTSSRCRSTHRGGLGARLRL